MTFMFISSLIILIIFLTLLTFILPSKLSSSSDFTSPFECGFYPMESSRMPFSLQFFLIAVIFLTFDVEITLLLPIPLISLSIQTTPLLTLFSVIMLILIAGLLYEWFKGALNWIL